MVTRDHPDHTLGIKELGRSRGRTWRWSARSYSSVASASDSGFRIDGRKTKRPSPLFIAMTGVY
jgi:hypothetical protein